MEGFTRLMAGRRTGLILGIMVAGVNAAYLFRNGGAAVIVTTVLLLAVVTAALMVHVRAWNQAEEETPTAMDYARNAALAFLLSASLYGIFG